MNEITKILVVEDSPTARRHTVDILVDAGYDVVSASDGKEAIELAGQYQPDVVVLDIVLPKKNGYQVCRTLRNDPRQETKILLLTAKDQESDRIWGERQGADGWLSKPVTAKDLLTAVLELRPTVAAN